MAAITKRVAVALSAAGVIALLGWRRSVAEPVRVTLDRATHGLRVDAAIGEDLSRALANRPADRDTWQRAVAVIIAGDSTMPVDGAYEISHSGIRFTPYFPLVPGLSYDAVVDLNRLRSALGLALDPSDHRRVERVSVPADPIVRRTVVANVYPSADALPENLLRLYIEFSRPMREGDAARNVALIDDAGRPVENAFLGLETELWDPSRRRLTVFLDPGRIKRGLRPNRELGPPLHAGHRYRLRVGDAWRDADGAPLARGHEKTFMADPADRAPLHVASWVVAPPGVGTSDAIVIRAPRPLDHALVRRLISVFDGAGSRVPTSVVTADGERIVRIVPERPWAKGAFEIAVGAELEDVAGNSFQRAFDVDLTDKRARRDDSLTVVRIPFVIGRP